MSDEVLGSYNGSGLARNAPDRAVDRVVSEAPRCEVARGARTCASCGHDAPGTVRLGAQASDRLVREVGSDAAALQVVADRRVTEAAAGHRVRPLLRQSRVVEVAGAAKDFARLASRVRADAPAAEALVHLLLRQGPPAKRGGGGLDGVRPPARPREAPRPFAVELATGVEARSSNRRDGQRPPRPAVQLDGDAGRTPQLERRYDGRATYFADVTFSGSALSSASAVAGASSRADTT